VESAFIVTFIGDDRPGLVEAVSSAIERSGGNWLESRLSQLGGKFAGLVLVNLPESAGPGLEETLRGLADSGLSVRVTPAASEVAPRGERRVTLTVVGPDRPGIVREISRALAAEQLNVVEMESEVSSAPMSGEQLFHACIEAELPAGATLEALQGALDSIADAMTLDIDLSPAG
jgi:glycine cleavage system regulatory protein|tara:strand:- start:643 stop:1167 length:525 start_codon:yes stop_codon:yes gene_type:complete